jgi:predicted transcriptional regulator
MKRNAAVLSAIESGATTSSEVAAATGMRQVIASNALLELYEWGVLDRTRPAEKTGKSGQAPFRYSLRPAA